ncbi:hypothetical protein J2S70_001346 [Trueperella bonasi]|uniref:Lipoprotein n=1 Tax=Trueperella bonasi TaxID=312286 RepID=A0ABT9NH85_9ACTO|nr:hypothetical protein [Trueperella bonasi]MDP9806764.1 hypothetical protein [Trueperella bonasi]
MRKLMLCALSAAFVLSSCSTTDELPQPTSGNNPHPIVTDEKYEQIAQETADGIAAANESLDSGDLTSRVSGPARNYRTAQLQLKSYLGDSYDLDPMLISPEGSPVVSGTAYPRTMMTTVPPRDGRNLTTLSVWSQNGPRSNYHLWADIELYGTANLPDIVSALSDTAGFPELDPADYAVDPTEVLKQYALYNGTREQQDIVFSAHDPLYTQIAAQQDAFVESLGELGTAATNFSVGDGGLRGVATESEGLVVVGEMIYQVKITKTNANATLRIGGEIGAMYEQSGDNAMLEIGDQGIANYAATVAFYVPPAGAEPVVEVIGASQPTLISVENVVAD